MAATKGGGFEVLMKTATTDILYFETGPGNEPTLRVEPGERFRVVTQMNAGPWLDDHADGEALRRKIRAGNPASGCIFVEGAHPGDLLEVRIHEITPHDIGFTHFGGSTGAMPAYFGAGGIGDHGRVVKIEKGRILWSDRLSLEARPMLGFVGTSPKRETRHNGWAGTWGGNLDMQEVSAGAAVYLPVEVEGALLHVGDMHALQGDGEICGAGGIETGGSAVLECAVLPRPKSFNWPRVVNQSHIMVAANDKPAEAAFRSGLENLLLWMEEEYEIPRADGFLLLGQVLEARVTQFVNPTYTYCLKVAKRYLEPS